MITKHPWFGPKTGMGWGWTPVTWEGWLVTAVCLAVFIGAYFVFGRTTDDDLCDARLRRRAHHRMPADRNGARLVQAAQSALAAVRSILACCS